MNAWDQDNLEWFVTCHNDEFMAWFDEAEQEEINYMFHLSATNRGAALMFRLEQNDEVTDVAEAQQLIDKICKQCYNTFLKATRTENG